MIDESVDRIRTCTVTVTLISDTLEQCSAWWMLVLALACVASSICGWLAGTWRLGVWAIAALRRWWLRRSEDRAKYVT